MSLRLLVVLASTVLLTACAGADPGSAGSGSGGTAPSSAPDSGGQSSDADVFPVVLTRVGGIAGFDDRITVAADGTTTVTTKRGPGEACRLTAATLDRVLQAVAALPTTPAARTSTRRVSDEMTTAVETALTTEPVRLGDAPQGATTIFVELLADVTGTPPAHTLCEG